MPVRLTFPGLNYLINYLILVFEVCDGSVDPILGSNKVPTSNHDHYSAVVAPSVVDEVGVEQSAVARLGVRRIEAKVGDLVDQIEFHFHNGTIQQYGKPGGQRKKPFAMLEGEYLVAFTVKMGTEWDGCLFVSSSGRQSEWHGGHGGKEETYRACDGCQIIGLQMSADGKRPVGIIEDVIGDVKTVHRFMNGEFHGQGSCRIDGNMGWSSISTSGYDDCRTSCIQESVCQSFSVDLAGSYCALHTILPDNTDGSSDHQCFVKRIVLSPGMPRTPDAPGIALEEANRLVEASPSSRQCITSSYVTTSGQEECSSRTVRRVQVTSGIFVDNLEFSFDDGSMQKYGREGGVRREPFDMYEGEHLVALTVKMGASFDGCRFITSVGRQSEWYGGDGGEEMTFCAKPGFHIIGLRMSVNGRQLVSISEEPLECKPTKQSSIWRELSASVFVIIFFGLCWRQWQSTSMTAFKELKHVKTQLSSAEEQCDRWRRHTEQRERDVQMEITRYRAERQKNIKDLKQCKSELTALQEHCREWRKYSEQQDRDLQLEVRRRQKAEHVVFSSAPQAHQEQMTNLYDELSAATQLQRSTVMRHDEELRTNQSQLQTALQESSGWRSRAEQHSRLLQQEMAQSEEARQRHEAKVSELHSEVSLTHRDSENWRNQAKRQEQEIQAMRKTVQEADGALRENVSLKKQLRKAKSAPSCQILAEQIAELECSPLPKLSADARHPFRKKLMVKWHPDKQPSAEHVTLATCVVQALQNRSEWTS